MKQLAHIIETCSSLAVFLIVSLAIAGTTYQVFNPDGEIFHWLNRTWDLNPLLLVVLGGIALLIRHWLSSTQGARGADFLFYGAIMVGLYYGFNLLLAT